MADFVRMTIRIPADLHKKMSSIAKKEDRSLAKQMLQFMRSGVQQFEATPAPADDINTQSKSEPR